MGVREHCAEQVGETPNLFGAHGSEPQSLEHPHEPHEATIVELGNGEQSHLPFLLPSIQQQSFTMQPRLSHANIAWTTPWTSNKTATAYLMVHRVRELAIPNAPSFGGWNKM